MVGNCCHGRLDVWSSVDKVSVAKQVVFIFSILMCLVIALIYTGIPKKMDLTGGCDQKQSPFMPNYHDDYRAITYCDGGDRYIGEITTNFFISKERVYFFYAGYPNENGIEIFLRNSLGQKSKILLPESGEKWKLTSVLVPSKFRGEIIQLVTIDKSTGYRGWVGIGNITTTLFVDFHNLVKVLVILILLHIFLMILLSAILKYTTYELAPLFLIILLGFTGYSAFWIYFFNSEMGKCFSIFFMLCVVILGLFLWKKQGLSYFRFANGVLLPVTLYTLFILVAAFFPFNEVNAVVAMNHWLDLPIDNIIPQIFANQLRDGSVRIPMIGDWLSSDRPPLQTGIYLIFPMYSEMFYQIITSVIQGLVFLPFLILVRRLEQPKLAPYAAVVFGLTSLIAVHTLYVWPKLISASYLLIFYLVTMTTLGETLSKREWLVLGGGSASLAMLSHGGAFFALSVTSLCYLYRYRYSFHALINGIYATIIAIIIYIPWILYQNFIDPPGNRLIKWHLFGIIESNDLTIMEAFRDTYMNLNFHTWFDGRINNLEKVFNGSISFLNNILFIPFNTEVNWLSWNHSIMVSSFFEFFYSLWWFTPIIAIPIWFVAAIRKKQHFNKDVIWLMISSLLTLLVWSLLMYIPGSTVIHHGSFLPWILLFTFSVILIWQASLKTFFIIALMNMILFSSVYIFNVRNYELFSESPYFIIVIFSFLAYIYGCKFSAYYLTGKIKKDEIY